MTGKERREYFHSKEKGCKCTGSYDDSYLLYGSATVFEYDTNQPPERNYLTWEEYRDLFHPVISVNIKEEKLRKHNEEMAELKRQIKELKDK